MSARRHAIRPICSIHGVDMCWVGVQALLVRTNSHSGSARHQRPRLASLTSQAERVAAVPREHEGDADTGLGGLRPGHASGRCSRRARRPKRSPPAQKPAVARLTAALVVTHPLGRPLAVLESEVPRCGTMVTKAADRPRRSRRMCSSGVWVPPLHRPCTSPIRSATSASRASQPGGCGQVQDLEALACSATVIAAARRRTATPCCCRRRAGVMRGAEHVGTTGVAGHGLDPVEQGPRRCRGRGVRAARRGPSTQAWVLSSSGSSTAAMPDHVVLRRRPRAGSGPARGLSSGSDDAGVLPRRVDVVRPVGCREPARGPPGVDTRARRGRRPRGPRPRSPG